MGRLRNETERGQPNLHSQAHKVFHKVKSLVIRKALTKETLSPLAKAQMEDKKSAVGFPRV